MKAKGMTAVEVLAAGSGVLAGCFYFRDILDPRRVFNLPVKVNCWFCCHDAKIPYKSIKAWTCPRKECSQYNGFELDGGYSKEIKEQHIDPDGTVGSRQIRYAQGIHGANEAPYQEHLNVLCRTCNLNQDLKIHQLRTFIPKNEADYDKEIEEFEAHLERTYRLCRYCEASLHQKLGEEDSWLRPKLLGWKLERNRQSPLSSAKQLKNSNKSVKYIEKIVNQIFMLFLIISALFASFLSTWDQNHLCTLVNNSEILLSAFGIDSLVPKNNFTTNEEMLQAFNINPKLLAIHGFREDVAILLLFTLVLGGFWSARYTIYQSLPHKLCIAGWTILVLENTLRNQTDIELPQDIRNISAIACIISSIAVSVVTNHCKMNKKHRQHLHNNDRHENASKQEPHWDWNNKRIQESLLDDTLTQDLVSTSTPVGSIIAPNSLSVSQSSAQMPTLAPSRLNITNQSYGNSQTDSFSSEKESLEKENTTGKQCDISTLQIDTTKQPTFLSPDSKNFDTLSMVSGAFSLKRYDVINKSGINFGDLSSNRASKKGPLLKPSKFQAGGQKGFTKSSWVAGGYWLNNKYQQNKLTRNIEGRPYDLPETMSNTSSQSSGFVSYSGQQPFASKNCNLFNNSKFHQLRSNTDKNVFSKFASDVTNPLSKFDRTSHSIKNSHHTLEPSKYENSFSLNPISEQLAFFDTSTSSKYGNSRPNSPLSQYNELELPNFTGMSHNFTSLHSKQKIRDKSFNSSLDGLTQEAFLELRPKAESSPVTSDKCNQNLKKKSWMEKKLTINISVYSIILFSSVAANIALIIYFLLRF